MKRILVFFISIFSFFSVFAKDVTLSSIKTSYNEIITDDKGNQTQTVKTNTGIELQVQAQIVNKDVQFNIILKNIPYEYNVSQDCIKTYIGNYNTDIWKETTSTVRLNTNKVDPLQDANACLVLATTGFCGLSVLDYYYSNSNRYSSTTSTGNGSVSKSVTIKRPDVNISISVSPDFVWLYSKALEKNQDAVSLAPTTYEGSFYIPAEKGPDYRLRIVMSKQEYVDFYFARSDRDDIIKPYKDRSYARHSLMFDMNVPKFDCFGFYYIYSGKPVGFYLGSALHIDNNDIDTLGEISNSNFSNLRVYNFNTPCFLQDITDNEENYINFDLGLTVKTVSNTWLMLGCSMDFVQKFYYGNSYCETPYHEVLFVENGWVKDTDWYFYIGPQFGVNLIFNHFDVAATYTYLFGKGPTFDLLVGYSF